MSPQFRSRIQFNLTRNRYPATIGLMVGAVALLFVQSVWRAAPLWLSFQPDLWLRHPWTLLTGSLTAGDVLMLLFNLGWLWLIGSTLEQRMGTRLFLILWAAFSAATGLAFYALFLLRLGGAPLYIFVPVDAFTVIWGMQYRGAVLNVLGIPLRGITVAWLSPLFTFICYAQGANAVTALCSLTGCAVALAWVQYNRSGSRFSSRTRVNNVTRIPSRRTPKSPESTGFLSRMGGGARTEQRFEELLKRSGRDD